jgi:glutamine amidotransferase
MSDSLVIIGSSGANLASLAFALDRLGASAPVTEDPERISEADRIILPGVGAAQDAMQRLIRAGLDSVIPNLTQPVLGICLGMQLLFSASDEDDADCLGVIHERVTRLPDVRDLPVPHMGWNEVEWDGESHLLDGLKSGGYAYFVHSYAVPIGPFTLASTDYGGVFSAVVQQGNFYGTQFHPERSSAFGSRILQNFLSI